MRVDVDDGSDRQSVRRSHGVCAAAAAAARRRTSIHGR